MNGQAGGASWTGLGKLLDLLLVSVALIVPAIGIGLYNPSTGSPAPEAAALEPDLDLVQSVCQRMETPESMRECYLDGLRPVLLTHGVNRAFGLLEELAQKDAFVRGEDHQLAHSLGRDAWYLVADIDAILAECPNNLHSGCTHGTLEAYMTTFADLQPEQVQGVCGVLEGTLNPFGFHQCLHGLGHGVLMSLGHDLFSALDYCDALTNQWQRGSCYDGVYMENLVSFQIANKLLTGDEFSHNHGNGLTFGEIRYDEPHFPCTESKEHQRQRCYAFQTSVFLTITGWNYRRAYELCDTAETQFRATCYNSMGRDISPRNGRDPEASVEWCAWGDDAYEGYCVQGAAKEFMTNAGAIEPAWSLCAAALEQTMRALCYQAIGEYAIILEPNAAASWLLCEKTPDPYKTDCRRGAQLTI